MTVLTEMLPVSVTMAERKLTGVYNFCNPGAISHNEILDMYKQVRPQRACRIRPVFPMFSPFTLRPSTLV
jgi:hypothetical protein